MRGNRHSRIAIRFALIIAFGMTGYLVRATGGELTPAQQSMLKDAQSQLGQMATNFKLAQDAAGGGQASPAKVKLALTRLGSARQAAAEVKARLAQLPADAPDVMALEKQFVVASSEIDAFEKSLTQDAQPTAPAVQPGTPSTPPTALPARSSAPAKLDYRQEEALKNARFNIREVEGLAGGAKQIADEVTSAPDVKKLDIQRVQQGINTVAKGMEKAGAARDWLDKLPPNGPGVAEARTELDRHTQTLAQAKSVLGPAAEKLSATINPQNYPNLAADTTRLRELASMYSNPNVFQEDRTKAAVLVTESKSAMAEHDRIVALYADLMRQQTQEGKQLEGISRHFSESMKAFAAAAEAQKQSLPKQIDSGLQAAIKDADDAVARQNAVFFQGAVSQKLEFVKEELLLYAALDSVGAASAQKKFDDTRKDLDKRQESLKSQIIAGNELPPNRYEGSDREQLIKVASEAWLKIQPGDKILSARIPSQQWNRESMWRHQTDAWYKIDRSKLQVQLLVAKDDQLATIRPIDLWKDHLNGDRVTAAPLHDPKDVLRPQDFILIAKIK